MMDIPHFAETGRRNPVAFLERMPEATYAVALDHLVFTCVDIAFLHQNHLLLARRKRYPRRTWWIIGGRMIAGETPIDAAQRKAAEEAGLANLGSDRFQLIGVYSTSFAFREQEPICNGSHSVNLTYQIVLTELEKQALKLTNQEYESDYQWLPLEQVAELVDQDSSLDQSLLKIVQDIQAVPTTLLSSSELEFYLR